MAAHPDICSCPAVKHGIIRVSGRDAGSFLNAQLSNDLSGIEAGETAIPAAWLDPKGRVRACFDVVPGHGCIDLLGPADLAHSLVSKLRMFVLRADVGIELAPVGCVAVVSRSPTTELGNLTIGQHTGAMTRCDDGAWVRLGPHLIVGYGSEAARVGLGLPQTTAEQIELAEIELGRPQVGPATESRFTAHMLNLDLIGAIAFDKGCYPGQEIVARTQNLGSPKRRLYRFSTAAPAPQVGTAILADAGDDVGTVLRSAPADSGSQMLAVVQTEAADRTLTLAAADSPLARSPLARLPIPYVGD